MLDNLAAAQSASVAPRLTMTEARSGAWADDAAMQTLIGWVESYLMRAHPDLGRPAPSARSPSRPQKSTPSASRSAAPAPMTRRKPFR